MKKANSKNKYELEVVDNDKDNHINQCDISEDGALLVVGKEDGTVHLWSTRTPETESLGVLRGHKAYITSVNIYDMFVVTGSADGLIKKWDLASSECIFTFKGHTNKINEIICFDEYLFSSSADCTARAWLFDATDDEYDQDADITPLIRVFKGHTKSVFPMEFIPSFDDEEDEDEDDDDVMINRAMAQHAISSNHNNKPPRWGDILITGGADNSIKAWSINTGIQVQEYKGHKGPITSLIAEPDSDIFYSGSMDKTIRSWDLFRGNAIKVFEGHEGPVLSLHYEKKLLYSGSADKTVRCWVAEFGDCIRTYKGAKQSITEIVLDKGMLYTASADGQCRVYEAKSGTLKRTFKGHTTTITCLAVADGRVYTGSNDGSLRSWDAKDLKEVDPINKDNDLAKKQTEKFKELQQKNLEDLESRLDPYGKPRAGGYVGGYAY